MATQETPVIAYRGAWDEELGLAPVRHLEPREGNGRSLAERLDARTGPRLIGQSAAWRDVLKKATQVAATETTVLLQGASGTGKEVVARLIHRASPRKDGPFVAINCAALPTSSWSRSVSAHERAAFTARAAPKPGQIEVASGVCSSHEIGEMSPSFAGQDVARPAGAREFQRLGATRRLRANIRVVTATNRDLQRMVERGEFREDLYYRLHVFEIRIPPLRERKEDLPLFADAFLKEIGRSLPRPPAGLTEEAKAVLLAHDWPGNVRELRNALERAAILCEGALIESEHLSLYSRGPAATTPNTTDLGTVERQTIERVLLETRWNKVKAAQRLGLTRKQLYGRLRKYDLDRPAPQ